MQVAVLRVHFGFHFRVGTCGLFELGKFARLMTCGRQDPHRPSRKTPSARCSNSGIRKYLWQASTKNLF